MRSNISWWQESCISLICDFLVFTWHLYISLGEVPVQIFCQFSIGLTLKLYYYRASEILYVFWIQVVYQVRKLSMFSPSMWLIFSFSWWCFFKVPKSNVSYFFSFYELCFGIISMKPFVNQRSTNVLMCFLLGVLLEVFYVEVYDSFWIIFCLRRRDKPKFSHHYGQLFQHRFLRDDLLSIDLLWHLCQKFIYLW